MTTTSEVFAGAIGQGGAVVAEETPGYAAEPCRALIAQANNHLLVRLARTERWNRRLVMLAVAQGAVLVLVLLRT